MALLSFVEDLDDNSTLFAVVADENGAEYVWPKGMEPLFDEERIARILDENEQEPPSSQEEWLSAATLGLGHVRVLTPEQHESIEVAIEEATAGLPNLKTDPFEENSDTLDAAAATFDDIAEKFPGFAEDVEGGEDPRAMLNYVMMVLGPIDPDGPNGFLLRIAEGNPQPGDEDAVIQWPDPGIDKEDEAS